MMQFSKPALQKLNSHLEKLDTSITTWEQNAHRCNEKNYRQSKIFIKNKNLAKGLLINLLFLKLEISINKRKTSSLVKKFLLNNKNIFTNKNLFTTRYLTTSDKYQLNLTDTIVKLTTNKKLKKKISGVIKKGKRQILGTVYKTANTLENCYRTIRYDVIGKWYIFLSRFLVLTLIHFVPFIQLTTSLFYTQSNRLVVHPVMCYVFQYLPFLLRIMKITMPIVNQDTFSFLLIGLYFQIFIVHFKSYKIPRKIAFQGTFSLLLMLLSYCMILNREILVVLYKFMKRFFFVNHKKFDLLRDDLNFYIDDLEELRDYKERFLQLGESVFSLDDITKVTKIYETTTLIPLLGVIALLYNCMYFILRGQKPIIPIVTKTVRRMMIDRNGTES